MPRIEPLPAGSQPEEIKRLFEAIGERGRDPSPLYRTLARAPSLLFPWAQYSSALRSSTSLGQELVELVTLRLAQLSKAAYQWAYHCERAKAAGLTDAQLQFLGTPRGALLLDERQNRALAYAESMVSAQVSAADFRELRRSFTETAALELTLLVGFYLNVGRVLQALDIEVDQAHQAFLPRGWPPSA